MKGIESSGLTSSLFGKTVRETLTRLKMDYGEHALKKASILSDIRFEEKRVVLDDAKNEQPPPKKNKEQM